MSITGAPWGYMDVCQKGALGDVMDQPGIISPLGVGNPNAALR